jgi:hypothetical protein
MNDRYKESQSKLNEFKYSAVLYEKSQPVQSKSTKNYFLFNILVTKS